MANVIHLPERSARRPVFPVVPHRTIEPVKNHLDSAAVRSIYAADKLRDAIRVAHAVHGAAALAAELQLQANSFKLLAEKEARQ